MKAILDGVVCKERTDLDQGLTNIPGFVFPEISRKTSPSMSPDHMCYGEIVSIGPGSINCPRIKGVSVGDVVLYDLANVDHAYYDSETSTGYQKLSQKALAAVLVREVDPEASERRTQEMVAAGFDTLITEYRYRVQALTDWVITTRDDAAMKRFIGGMTEVPDAVLIDGQRTDELQDGSMRLIVERVVSAGIGRRYSIRLLPHGDPGRLAYDDIRAPDRYVERMSVPQCVAGDLLLFSPSASTKFRRNGRSFRATPWDEMQAMLVVE